MALSLIPVASSNTATLTPVAGTNRIVAIEIRGESGFVGTLDNAQYGPAGPAAFRIETRPLVGNQLFYHIAWFDETAIAARTSDVITLTWSSAPPASTTHAYQYNDIEQSLPINDFQEDSNPAGGIASPPSVSALDGSVVVESAATGNGSSTFTWTPYTQHNTQGGAAYTWDIATRAVASAASIASVYSVTPAPNRSALFVYSLNEVGSVGVGITDINSGTPLKPGDTATITGAKFEAVQGAGVVTLSPTDNVLDSNAVVLSSVTSWADTSIQVPIPNTLSLLYGTIYVFVTNNTAETNPNGFVVTLNPPATNDYVTIFTQHDDGVLAGVTGIEANADQIEWQILSDGGGTVHIGLSGIFSIRDYPGAVPATDTIYLRLGDKSDESWSSSLLQAVGINQSAGGAGGKSSIAFSLSLSIGI